jgi:hypothetical protein
VGAGIGDAGQPAGGNKPLPQPGEVAAMEAALVEGTVREGVSQVTNVQSAVEQPGLSRVAAVVLARLERQVEFVDRLEGATSSQVS